MGFAGGLLSLAGLSAGADVPLDPLVRAAIFLLSRSTSDRNRSPSAYLANPAEERARYQYDQDKDLTLVRFDDTDGNARGFLSFFAVHGTSIYEVRDALLLSSSKPTDERLRRTIP